MLLSARIFGLLDTLPTIYKMINKERPYSKIEIEKLKSMKYALWDHFENFGMKFGGITLILLAPFILYDKYIYKVSSQIQFWSSVALVIISISIVLYWMKWNGELYRNKKINNEIRNGKAHVLRIQTDKVIKRKDPEDYGAGYYFKLDHKRTLYLQGQYCDELNHSRKFPNTDFEIVRAKLHLDELIQINFYGKYLKPIKSLKSFSDEQYENGNYHYDNTILELNIDEIE